MTRWWPSWGSATPRRAGAAGGARAAARPMKIGDVTPDGLRLVGKLAGGGGVWEPVNKGSGPQPEAA